jgi:hypothetical protein
MRLGILGLPLVLTLSFGALAPLAPVTAAPAGGKAASAETETKSQSKFEQDRRAILAMAGDYSVSFDFIETVALAPDYQLKERKKSGGDEIVRVLEDRGNFISLQHTLIIPGERPFALKHWRQDWVYQPVSIPEYVGANVWKKRKLSKAERKGQWAQLVYQVDDGPRYAAVAAWRHENGNSSWAGEGWRPLPRRDATTRSDYHAIEAVNRHVITPTGWVHEQDNTKLVLTGANPRALVREIGVNTYQRACDFDIALGDAYWAKTAAFWESVRKEWKRFEQDFDAFALTIQGEPAELYDKLLALAEKVEKGEQPTEVASQEAIRLIDAYVTTDPQPLRVRLAGSRDSDVVQPSSEN